MIEVHFGYCWFLRLKLADKVVNAFTAADPAPAPPGATIAYWIFDRIVEQAIQSGTIDGAIRSDTKPADRVGGAV